MLSAVKTALEQALAQMTSPSSMPRRPSLMPAPSALWRGLMDGCHLMCRNASGYEAHLLRDSGQILTGEPHADMNFAFIGSPSETARHLWLFHERAATRGLPMIVLSPPDTAEHLTAEAESLGYVPAGEVPLMVCLDPDPGPASHPYVIENIDDPALLSESTPVSARAFGLPDAAVVRVYNPDSLAMSGVDYFIARRDGEVWSFVQTTRIGAQVGIWAMATAPEYRGQGAGRALLEAVLTHHRRHGAELFYLMASSAGQRLYEQVGFHETSRLASWLSGSSAQLGAG